VMRQMAKSLPGLAPGDERTLAEAADAQLERIKWLCWHGNTFRARQEIEELRVDLEYMPENEEGDEEADVEAERRVLSPEQRKLIAALDEFDGYLAANAAWIPNYGERYRCAEPISSAFVESAVNQIISKRMVKKQQMRWDPLGAHLFLQVRTRVLNNDLSEDFRRWYPAFTHRCEPLEDAELDDLAVAA